MQAQFGLRREEAIKFQPAYAIRPNRIHLKPSWTKGGRPRDIPVRNDAQRELLVRVLRLAGKGSLIPHGRSYAQQRNLYERQTRAAGIADGDRKAHGLRLGLAPAAVSRTHRLEAAPCRRPKAGGIDT
ncbi:MAG: integrase domain-containing protein [Proteobacteria bacterium]|nr:integrase domain-containing protein [Pseudomonadota bacterium]